MLKINRSRKAESTLTELLDDDLRAISCFSDWSSPISKNLANVSEPPVLNLQCRSRFSFSITEVGFEGVEVHVGRSSKESEMMQVRPNQSNHNIEKALYGLFYQKDKCTLHFDGTWNYGHVKTQTADRSHCADSFFFFYFFSFFNFLIPIFTFSLLVW